MAGDHEQLEENTLICRPCDTPLKSDELTKPSWSFAGMEGWRTSVLCVSARGGVRSLGFNLLETLWSLCWHAVSVAGRLWKRRQGGLGGACFGQVGRHSSSDSSSLRDWRLASLSVVATSTVGGVGRASSGDWLRSYESSLLTCQGLWCKCRCGKRI